MELLQKILRKYLFFINIPILLSFFLFLIFSIYITYPLIFHLSDFISGLGDELYIDWILNWNIYSFTHNFTNILNTNIFFPYNNTLAYSETFLTSSIIGLLPAKIIGEPAVAYNFNFIFSLLTLGFFTYFLGFYITKNHFSSFISGTLVAFSSYTLAKPMHLQLLNIGWVPLSILFFLKFLDKKQYKFLILSSVFFIIQVYNSFLPGYFIIFSCFFILGYYIFKKKIKLKELHFSKILVLLFFTVLIIAPIVIPYYQVSKEFNYTRDIRESIHNANRPEYTLYPGNKTKLYDVLKNTFYKYDKGPYIYDGYIGLMFFILLPLTAFFWVFNKKKKPFLFDAFFLIGISSFILSLGPALQWGGKVIKLPFIIPLPYALLYYIVPGFNGMRNSARWEMLFLVSISICIGIFLSEYFKNKPKRFYFLLSTAICLIILLEFKFPYNYYKIPTKENFPKIYTYIETLPKHSVIAQFPIYNWDTFFNGPYPENVREYYYTLSFPKTINGTAGFDPPPWQENIRFLIKNFPNNNSLFLLKKMRVNYIIVNKDEYDQINGKKDIIDNKIFKNGKEVIGELSVNKNIKLLIVVDGSYVYKIY